MGVTYAPAFDLSAIRDGQTATDYDFSMTITGAGDGAGWTPLAITSADFFTYAGSTVTIHDAEGNGLTGVVNHENQPMFTSYGQYNFAQALQIVLNAKMLVVAAPWTGTFDVSFSSNELTISRATGTFTFSIAWAQSASRWLCGFSADESTPSTSFVGGLTPNYWIDATLDGRSLDLEGDFEIDGIASLSIGDSATVHSGVSRSTAAKYRSWWQSHELKAKVHKSAISGTVRWTFEHLFEHCRCHWPFIVDDGVEKMACVFTDAGAVWRNKQRSGGPGDDVAMNIPFNVWHAGNVSAGG